MQNKIQNTEQNAKQNTKQIQYNDTQYNTIQNTINVNIQATCTFRSPILPHPAPPCHLTQHPDHSCVCPIKIIKSRRTNMNQHQPKCRSRFRLGWTTSFWPLRGTSMLELWPVVWCMYNQYNTVNWNWPAVWSGQPNTEKRTKQPNHTTTTLMSTPHKYNTGINYSDFPLKGGERWIDVRVTPSFSLCDDQSIKKNQTIQSNHFTYFTPTTFNHAEKHFICTPQVMSSI